MILEFIEISLCSFLLYAEYYADFHGDILISCFGVGEEMCPNSYILRDGSFAQRLL